MTSADWIKLLVPIISNIFISGIVVTIISKKINDSFEKTKKRKDYAYYVLGDIKKYLDKIKIQIIYMQSGLTDNYKEEVKKLFIAGGDLQVFIENYKEYMLAASPKLGDEFFQIKKLEEVIENLTCAGLAIQEPEKFAKALNSTLKVCNEVISYYNNILVEA